MKSAGRRAPGRSALPPQRSQFAHPFFSSVPPAERPRMLDFIKGTLHAIPPVKRNGRFALGDIIGVQAVGAIEKTGHISFHVAGDTGVPETDHETRQVMVADAMAKDYDPASPATGPAFFLHLGDVIYGPAPNSYLDQFYRPYMHYPGKIIAIPGNHDGETPAKMRDFQKNFCAASQVVPPIAGSIYRQTMNQPGVYWCLDAPFVQIVGLYSNAAENPGFISGRTIGQKQKQWLVRTLRSLNAERKGRPRKALIMVTHHPPFSSGGHSGSTDMLADIDDACTQAGVMPDAFFSGHAHSIQRYRREVSFKGKTLSIPYIVSGCGGHGDQTVAPATATPGSNPAYEFSYMGWGYTTVVVDQNSLTIISHGVSWNRKEQIDRTSVSLVQSA